MGKSEQDFPTGRWKMTGDWGGGLYSSAIILRWTPQRQDQSSAPYAGKYFKSHYIQLLLAAEESRGNLLALNERAQVLEAIEAQKHRASSDLLRATLFPVLNWNIAS